MRISEQNFARHYLYSFFSSAFSDPLRSYFDLALRKSTQIVAEASANVLSAEIGAGIVMRRLGVSREELAEQHQRLFGLTVSSKLPANETEYCRTRDTTYRSQQMADIAGFYEAFRFDVNQFDGEAERLDHIVLELGFMGFLAAKEIIADSDEKIRLCRDAEKSFFSAHLGWWTPLFAAAVKDETASGFYAALADSLANFVACEQIFFGLEKPRATAERSLSCRDASSAKCGGCPLSS